MDQLPSSESPGFLTRKRRASIEGREEDSNDSSDSSPFLEYSSPTSSSFASSPESIASYFIEPLFEGARQINVILSHKPRGSKGAWEALQPEAKVRVTKDKGKKLALEAHTGVPYTSITNEEGSVRLQLYKLEPGGGSTPCDQNAFRVEGLRIYDNLVKMELKVFVLYKKLLFVVNIRTVTGDFLMGQSIVFGTHNSGTAAQGSSEKHLSPIPSPDSTSPDVDRKTKRAKSSSSPPPARPPPKPSKRGGSAITDSRGQQRRGYHSPEESASPVSNEAASVDESVATMDNNEPTQQPALPPLPPSSSPSPSLPPPAPIVSASYNLAGNLNVEGAVKAHAFMQYSDLRLKMNIVDITDALDIVNRLQGKIYEWKPGVMPEDTPGRRVIGLIAQDVYNVLPQVVRQDANGLLSVSYAEILPVLIQAFKEFLGNYQAEKGEFQRELASLKNQLDAVIEMRNPLERSALVTSITSSSQTLFSDNSRLTKIYPDEAMMESQRSILDDVTVLPKWHLQPLQYKNSFSWRRLLRWTSVLFFLASFSLCLASAVGMALTDNGSQVSSFDTGVAGVVVGAAGLSCSVIFYAFLRDSTKDVW